VVYLTSPNAELKTFLDTIGDHQQNVITDLKGLEAEKWFFMELHEGCELKGRPLPKNVARGVGFQERKHTFSQKNEMITYSSGTTANQ